MDYAKTDIEATIKRLEMKHGEETVIEALKLYIALSEFDGTYISPIPDDERWAGEFD